VISTDQIQSLHSATVVGANGERIGDVGQVLVDTATGAPEWVSVRTGLFGTKETLVPISEASFTNGEINVPFTKDQIKGAPNIAPEHDLSQEDEATLYSHYGMNYSDSSSSSGLPQGGAGFGGTTDTGGIDTDRTFSDRERGTDYVETDRDFATTGTAGTGSDFNRDDAMTRSEERVHVGTEKVQTGVARLRKWVETEQVNVPVTVSKEKVRLEREPITDANRDRALDGPEITENEFEVTLSEERPIVSKETVPVERVRLEKEVETEQVNVSETVRKEQIDTDGLDTGLSNRGDVYPDETRTTESDRNLR